MNQNFRFWQMLSVLMVFVLLAGCAAPATPTPQGPVSTSVPASAATSVETSVPASTPAPATGSSGSKPVVIYMYGGPEHDNLVKTAQAYQQKTGQEIVIEEIPRESLRDKVTAALMAGAPDYDVMYIAAQWVPEFVAADALADFDPFINDPKVVGPDYKLEDKQPGVSIFTVDGKIYGFPSEGDTAWLFYREDLLNQAGLKVPETWDEYLQVAQKLNNQPEIYGTVIGASRSEAMFDFTHYLFGSGGTILDPKTMQVTLNDEKGVAALQYYVDLLRKHKVVSPDVTTFGYNEILSALQQGKAAMGIEWMAATHDLTSCDVSPKVCKVLKYTQIPGYKAADGSIVHNQFGTESGWIIPKASQNKEAAYKFLEWLTGPEGAKMWALNGGIPDNRSVLSDPEVVAQVPQFKLLAQIAPYRHLFPVTTVTNDIMDAMNLMANTAAAGEKTPQEAADAAAATITDALKKAGYIK